MSEKTTSYILDCRKKGFSDEQIRKKLLETGYNTRIVDRLFKELEEQKTPKRWFPVLPALALILIVAVLALTLRTGNEVTVDLIPVDSMTKAACAVDSQQWSFFGNCVITKTIDIPKKLQGKPLTLVLEASGTPLFSQDWRTIDTFTFIGMSAKEFLERNWGNTPSEFTLEVISYDSLLNQTTTSIFEAGHWPEGINASILSLYFNQTFQSLGNSSLGCDDLIVENITLSGNTLTISKIQKERYDTPWPVFNASVAGESHIVELDSGEWKSYEIQLQPQTESIVLTLKFMNDIFLPSVNEDGSLDLTTIMQDRNLFIRKVLIRGKEK